MPRPDPERWVTAALGAACLFAGFRRRSAAGLLLTSAGAAMAWWAAGGSEERRSRRAQLRAVWPRPIDEVGEASEESFPASDAPAWTSTTGSAGNGHHPVSR